MFGSSVVPDFDDTTKSVRLGIASAGRRQHGRGLGRIEHLEQRIARPAPEGVREHERGEARPSHPEHEDPVGPGDRLLDEARSRPDRAGSMRSAIVSQPSALAIVSPAAPRRLPERGVSRPDPADRPILRERFERLAVGAFAAGEVEFQATLIAFSFSASAFKQRVEGVGELLDPSSSSSREIRSLVDAELAPGRGRPPGPPPGRREMRTFGSPWSR